MAKKATAEENVEVAPQPVAKKQPKIEKNTDLLVYQFSIIISDH